MSSVTFQVSCLITQNVDQLHYKAGSRHVIELHGTNSRVTCMSCCFSQPRLQFQRILETHNPDMRTWVRQDNASNLKLMIVLNFRLTSSNRMVTWN